MITQVNFSLLSHFVYTILCVHVFNDPERLRMLILVSRRCEAYVNITQGVILDKS